MRKTIVFTLVMSVLCVKIIAQTNPDSILLIARKYHTKAKYEKVLEKYLNAINIYHKCGDSLNITKLHLYIGDLYFDLKIYNKAINNYMYYRANCTNINQNYSFGYINDKIAKSYQLFNKPDSAIKYYSYEYAWYRMNNMKKAQISILCKMSNLYTEQKKYQKAVDINKEIFSLTAPEKDTANLVLALNNIGYLYKNMQKYELAIRYFEKLSFYAEIYSSQYTNQYKIYLNIGSLYLSQKQYFKAEKAFGKAISIAGKNNDTTGLVTTYNRIANDYYLRKRFTHAIKFAEKAAEVFNHEIDYDTRKATYHMLYLSNYSIGNANKVLYYFDLYDKTSKEQTITSYRQNEKQLAMQETIRQKEKEIIRLISQNEAKQKELERLKLFADTTYKHNIILLKMKKIQELNLTKEKLNKEAAQQQLIAYEAQMKAKKKDAEIALLEKEKRIRSLELAERSLETNILKKDMKFNAFIRKVLIIGIAFLIAVIIMIVKNYKTRLKRKRLLIKNERLINAQNLELERAKTIQLEDEKEKLELERSNKQLILEKTQSELKLKQKQLVSYALMFSHKNSFLKRLNTKPLSNC